MKFRVMQLLGRFLRIFRQCILNESKTFVSRLSFVLYKKTSPDWSQLAEVCLEVLRACGERYSTYKHCAFVVFGRFHLVASCALLRTDRIYSSVSEQLAALGHPWLSVSTRLALCALRSSADFAESSSCQLMAGLRPAIRSIFLWCSVPS